MIRHQGVSRSGIKIGKNCWIGSKVTVLDGVTIGDNCVIAAGAVITKDKPSNSVIGGVPAKVIKEISKKPTKKIAHSNNTKNTDLEAQINMSLHNLYTNTYYNENYISNCICNKSI